MRAAQNPPASTVFEIADLALDPSAGLAVGNLRAITHESIHLRFRGSTESVMEPGDWFPRASILHGRLTTDMGRQRSHRIPYRRIFTPATIRLG